MSIDRSAIIKQLSNIRIIGNDEGLIPVFGVYIQQLPADFWNQFARRLINSVPENIVDAAEGLLVNAAHECGYHTGHGIITSKEWKEVVEPMIERVPEDILHGAFAVFSAWGWANAEIMEIIPHQRMVVHAYDYYERDIVTYKRVDRPAAYMVRGVSAAFMDLAYGGPYDPTGKTGMNTFTCQQTKGIELNDNFGEFIVTRSR